MRLSLDTTVDATVDLVDYTRSDGTVDRWNIPAQKRIFKESELIDPITYMIVAIVEMNDIVLCT